MIQRIAILRPEPDNAATALRVRETGLEPLSLPLFVTRPLDWTAPDPAAFDGLLLTSANALRHGGTGLAALISLPVLAVGIATATAAREAGFQIDLTGSNDVAGLLTRATGYRRLLWLSGRERTALNHPALDRVIPVYAADARALDASDAQSLMGTVALLHSTRAAIHLIEALDRHGIARDRLRIAAISTAVAAAAGDGWDRIVTATAPDDPALIAAARALAIDP